MIYTIAVIFLILWILGIVGAYTVGSVIHILLVAAIILVLVRVIQGKNPIR
ncbi:MAG: lmo0937 family membrane protein [Candidatus Paceibacterota bacterium]